MEPILNTLASRYASSSMRAFFSERGRILLEREFWIAVLRAERDLGLDIPAEAVAAYDKVKADIRPESIREREQTLRHDVKARLEEFNALAGFQCIHQGMTSRDLTDNVEQLQIQSALELVRDKTVRALDLLAGQAAAFRDQVMVARTHNVPAQATTLGKRLAMFGAETLRALERLEFTRVHYPLRGLQGAVGTLLDPLTLFDGDTQKTKQLQERILEHLGVNRQWVAVGQVYPRSLDFEVVSGLCQLAAGPASFCTTLRLMAGLGLVSEGFQKGQVGSSAMPHKQNARNAERVCSLLTLLQGHVTMASALAGDQWNEGDVSCSAARRVFLCDAFFAIDGILETWMTILKEMQVHTPALEAEFQNMLPSLATTTLLMHAVRAGLGRESAYAVIQEHAKVVAQELQQGTLTRNDLLDRLARDTRLPLDFEKIRKDLTPLKFTGLAREQTDAFVALAASWMERFPDARRIEPEPLL